MTFGAVALLAFWTVLVAELVGDKSIYSVTSLSLRFRSGPLLAAMVTAFAGKMLGAVLLASVIARFDSRWTDALSAVAFFAAALFVWFREPVTLEPHGPEPAGWWRAAMVCAGTLFLSEWGDPGQIAAAALAAKTHAPAAVWIGGTAAMTAKGGLALAAGLKLRNWIPQRVLRAVASAACGVMGALSLRGAIL